MCLFSLCACVAEFLPYLCLVTVPFFGAFCGIDIILRLSLLIFLYTIVTEYIPNVFSYIIPYLNIGVLLLIIWFVPVGIIPYPVIWLYDKILWLSDPVLLMVEVVLGLNFVMHCSRQCAEKIDEDEDEAWKWKLLLTLFSAACYAVLAVLVFRVYQDGSNIHFWMVLLVSCFSMLLAAHNMMWMSHHEGIVSDVAFVTLTSMVIIYTMKEEVVLIQTPLSRPITWYSLKKSGSLIEIGYQIISTSLDNAQVAIQFSKRFLSPVFMVLLGIRLFSILFLTQRVIKNFGFETEESYIEDLEADISPWKSPLIIKCAIIFMITQSTTRLFYQSSGLNMFPSWWGYIINKIWPPDILFGRILQIVVVNVFYIWRLYCADDWQWSDWFSA